MTHISQNNSEADRLRVYKNEIYVHASAVFRFAKSLTKDRQRSEDLMQDVMIKAFNSIDQYTEGTNAKAWLMRICFNMFVNEERKNKRRPKSSLEANDLQWFSDAREEPQEYDAYNDEILRALSALREDYRTVFILAVEGHQYAEIAEITGYKLNTVRTKIHRARLQLAKNLANYSRSLGYGLDTNLDLDA